MGISRVKKLVFLTIAVLPFLFMVSCADDGPTGPEGDVVSSPAAVSSAPASEAVSSVPASAPAEGLTLTTNVRGEGRITVRPLQETYSRGTQVSLTASPLTGWTFVRWEGSATGSNRTINFTINNNSTITAVFERQAVSSPAAVSSAPSATGRLANITRSCAGISVPGPVQGGSTAWASRYWDCCKPHCAWRENASPHSTTCDATGRNIVGADTPSGCDGGNAFTCYNQAPFAVCEDFAYGFAAVHAPGARCGVCYLIEFDGGFQHGTPGEAHRRLQGKRMIVMTSNIGGDVQANQFDLMIPGGGLGLFTTGCQRQWNVNTSDESIVGVRYGGFTTRCENQLGWNASVADMQNCVRGMCDRLFGNNAERRYLWEGCIWYVEWMYAANNPTFRYTEIACPQALRDLY